MQMHIKEFAVLTGVSVRTLHYYDEIGLLHPAAVDEQNGYRMYDEISLLRMQEILFYRELDFPLKAICRILNSPHYDKREALAEQKRLLLLKKERLEKLIDAVDLAAKGEIVMSAFDNKEYEKYKDEAKERWGKTEAYREYEARGGKVADRDAIDGMNGIFADFARVMQAGATPGSAEAQAAVEALQIHITKNFYTCTKEILAGLGQMYTADERFKANIDSHGAGTADFAAAAIAIYCR